MLLKFTKVTLDIVGIPSRKMCLKDIEIAPECFAAGSVYTVLRGLSTQTVGFAVLEGQFSPKDLKHIITTVTC